MLTVRDIANLPGLGLELAAGATGADNPIRWVHVSELPDPTPWLEGGELLITTGLGIGELSRPQREYVRRLAGHGLAGLAFGVGFGWAEPPAALADEAERLDFPLVTVPYEVPFIALTKAISSRLANAQLARLERALEVHERLARLRARGPGSAGAAGDPGRPRRLLARARRRGGPRRRRASQRTARRLRARARAAGRRRRRDLVAAGRQAARRALGVRPPRAPPRPVRARLRALAAARGLGRRAAARGRPARGPRARPARRARDRTPDRRVRARPAGSLRGAPRGRGRRPARRRRPHRGGQAARRPRRALPLRLTARSGRVPRRDRPRGGRAHDRAGSWSRPRREPGSVSAVPRRDPASAAACSRRAPRSTRSPGRSPPTRISARSSCC